MRLITLFLIGLCFSFTYGINDDIIKMPGELSKPIELENGNKIHYYLTDEDYRFINGNNPDYILNNYDDSHECRIECGNNENCVGIYEELTPYKCNTLSNLGGMTSNNNDSKSYSKIIHHEYPLDKHSITGFMWDYSSLSNNINNFSSTIYIDLNHNGELDDNEPSTIAKHDEEFTFDNLNPGSYIVRQIQHNGCTQVYPGINGSFEYGASNINGDGYVDNVIRYKHNGHITHSIPHGGIINKDTNIISNKNFSFIIGDDNTTYMSFYDGYSITLTLNDESMVDREGNDLFINTYLKTDINADVMVSSDDNYYEKLGVLNTDISISKFDLSNINRKDPVNFIRLDFYSTNQLHKHGNVENPLNIVSIKINKDSIYLPAYSYKITVPDDKTSILFLNDCNHNLPCSWYCDMNYLSDDDYLSCINGCNSFKKEKMCLCNYANNEFLSYDDIQWYDDEYSYEFSNECCDVGCDYEFQKYIFPNYTLVSKTQGLEAAEIMSLAGCDSECVDKLMKECNNLDECRSFSLTNNKVHGHLYKNIKILKDINSRLLLKNNYADTTTSTTITETWTSITTTATDTTTTSTTATKTSTTATDTSTTHTSTTATDTSTTHTSTTATKTSTTHTSTTATKTSTTHTSTTATDTSTTHTSTTATDTSTTHTFTTTTNKKHRSNSKIFSKYTTLLVLLVMILLVIIITITLYCYKKRCFRRNYAPPIQEQMQDINRLSFDNPVYNGESPENIEYDINTDSHYNEININSDKQVSDLYNDYIEIQDENDE